MNFETWMRSDLKKPLDVKQLKNTLFLGDDDSNLIGVEVLDNGSTATLSGDVYGYIIRDDDMTVVVQGALDGNKASIILPDVAYAVPGSLSIVIKVAGTTVGACVGRVYKSQTDTIADPDDIIPSVEQLLQRIQDAENACTGAETAEENAETAERHAEAYATSAQESATYAQSAVLLTPSQPIAIPSSNSSKTYNMEGITADHQLVRWNFSSSPENLPPCNLNWTTGDGYFTISHTDSVSTSGETIQPVFNKPLEKTATQAQ